MSERPVEPPFDSRREHDCHDFIFPCPMDGGHSIAGMEPTPMPEPATEPPFISATNAYVDDTTDPPTIIVALLVDGAWHTYRMTQIAAGDLGAHLGLLANDYRTAVRQR